MILEFPGDFHDYVGDGSLVIELDVDLRQAEGWQEKVEYKSERPLFRIYKERKGLEGARSHCEKEGGYLASIHSQEENNEIVELANDSAVWVGGNHAQGGHNLSEYGVWAWDDGSNWTFSNWADNEPKGYGCLGVYKGEWYDVCFLK